VQKRLGTAFDLAVVADRGEELLSIDRSGRGRDDPLCFVITYNPEALGGRSAALLRSDALHELIHAMWWPFYEAGSEGRTMAEKRELLRVFETCTYETERRLGPHVLGQRAHSKAR